MAQRRRITRIGILFTCIIIFLSVILSLEASPWQVKPPQQNAPLPQEALKLEEIPLK